MRSLKARPIGFHLSAASISSALTVKRSSSSVAQVRNQTTQYEGEGEGGGGGGGGGEGGGEGGREGGGEGGGEGGREGGGEGA